MNERVSLKRLAQAVLFLVILVALLGAWRVLGLWSIPVYAVVVWLAFNGYPRLRRRAIRGRRPS
jgi:hypothetical protein